MSIFGSIKSFFIAPAPAPERTIKYQIPTEQLGRTFKKEFSRDYSAAAMDRLTADWTTRVTSGDTELRQAFRILLARSRDQERNNPHVIRYLSMIVNNVLGHLGPQLDMKTVNLDGTPDEKANLIIETAWRSWGKRGRCTVCRGMTLRSLWEQLLVRACIDGSVFVRRWPGFDNPQRFALQVIEAQYIDFWYNVANTPEGNQIRMGVEMNPATGETLAYHFLKYDPTDFYNLPATSAEYRTRIPASEVLHIKRNSR